MENHQQTPLCRSARGMFFMCGYLSRIGVSFGPRLGIRHWMAIVLCVGLALPGLRRILTRSPELDILSSRFALIGKIDANRDGKDDRAAFKRVIAAAGGSVDYDLPAPKVGQEVAKLAPRIDWYVVDDRTHCPSLSAPTDVGWHQFATRVSERIKEARLDGIKPMPLSRLVPIVRAATSQGALRGR